MALTVGLYVWPSWAHAVAVAAVIALTAVNYAGIQKSALLTRVIVAVVLAVLAAVVVVILGFGDVDAARLNVGDDISVGSVLQAAGLLFFAFAGYARIATLGEEVRDPARTIPRAIPIALGIALVVYAVVAIAAWPTWHGRFGFLDRPARRRGHRGGTARSGTGDPGGCRGGRARLAVGTHPRGLAYDAGDVTRPSPAARARRGAPAVRQPAPRRDRGRRRRRGRGGGGRRARRDRLLVLRGAAVLRDRQRVGVDAGTAGHSGRGTGGLPGPGVPVAAVVGRIGAGVVLVGAVAYCLRRSR